MIEEQNVDSGSVQPALLQTPCCQHVRALNLYAGLGGNADLWDESKMDITHVELNPKIASVLQRRKPNQKVTPAAFCCTGIQGTESSAVDSEASIAENRSVSCCYGWFKTLKIKIWKKYLNK